jgi:hypothetical protein
MRVKQLQNRSGRDVPNQFVIETKDGEYFQSYRTLIAFRPRSGRIKLSEDSWDYSRTTLKYLCQFLGLRSKADILHRIKDGWYILENFEELEG